MVHTAKLANLRDSTAKRLGETVMSNTTRSDEMLKSLVAQTTRRGNHLQQKNGRAFRESRVGRGAGAERSGKVSEKCLSLKTL